ncbi:hypothetical protein ISCGN_004583 [Ixodes scapularis]
MPNLLPTITQVLGCLCIISDVRTTSVTGRLWKIGDHSPVDQGESSQPLHVDKTYYAYAGSTVTSHNHQDSSQLLHIKATPVPAHFSGHGNHAVAMPNLLPTITQSEAVARTADTNATFPYREEHRNGRRKPRLPTTQIPNKSLSKKELRSSAQPKPARSRNHSQAPAKSGQKPNPLPETASKPRG